MHSIRVASLATIVASTFLSSPAIAGLVMSADCGEPVGVRYDRVGNETRLSDDGFSGVHPQFTFSESNPKVITVLWADTGRLENAARQHAFEATIINSSDSAISAIVTLDSQVMLYTLHPAHGAAYMSVHKTVPTQPEILSAATFKLECKFQFD